MNDANEPSDPGADALARIVAPTLRGLFGGPEALALARFEPAEAPAEGDATVRLASDDETAVPRALRDAAASLAAPPAAVFVEGLGRFEITPPAGWVRPGRAAGKVALVTGAAQGFGLEIARDLARQGALVALGDLNEPGAREGAEGINRELDAPVATALGMNVASEESVAAAFDTIVRTFGGLDVLVSNAGVLRAESVKTQSVADFELVGRVNYTGYFLCVRAAAPILAAQHHARPDVFSDIIQINSKSGLAGSNRNFAYAGSKFGGIGLTQSFALELVEDGVKVNAVCPGNFFDGPLWSDPETGLFVQYLRAGKVPGAKTVDDVRKAYEAKAPMKRGCTAPDVMRAIYYLIEQQYETGQALPVTGGQVMPH